MREEQPELDATLKLPPRQRLAYDLIDGIGSTAAQVGVELHGTRGCKWCQPGEPCAYAELDGRNVLVVLRRNRLAVRRRSGVWQRADAKPPVSSGYDPSSAEIPF